VNPSRPLPHNCELRDRIWERTKGRCEQCGKVCRRDKRDRYDSGHDTGYDLGEIDHIVARRDGGLTVAENLQLLCIACNRQKAGQAVVARGCA
jgi:5-methylcytosine-specific restriction endonuclease McrA